MSCRHANVVGIRGVWVPSLDSRPKIRPRRRFMVPVSRHTPIDRDHRPRFDVHPAHGYDQSVIRVAASRQDPGRSTVFSTGSIRRRLGLRLMSPPLPTEQGVPGAGLPSWQSGDGLGGISIKRFETWLDAEKASSRPRLLTAS